ncbi:MAG: Wzz/FepE/Etk N-terminal domain-containing protein, partial [Planctomycetota bacterium]|nr:Wzz/FepE/Etk N-terminal domain-containing protein [Planctomycetota bacterium]
MDSALPQTSLRDLAFIAFKWKWSIVTIIVVTMLSAFIYLWFIRGDVYQAQAKILVKLGQEQASPPTTIGQQPMIVSERFQEVKSEIDILRSTDLLANVVEEMGLDGPPADPPPRPDGLISGIRYDAKQLVSAFREWKNETLISIGLRPRLTDREKAIATLEKGLFVQWQDNTNVIAVYLGMPNRETPAVILNELLDEYLRFRLEVLRNPSAVAFFQQQAAESAARLDEIENRLHDFEVERNIRALDEQKSSLLSQIADARIRAEGAEVAYEEARQKVTRMEEALASDEPDFASLGAFETGSFPESLLRDLAELRRERERLRLTDLEDSARFQNNRRQFNSHLELLASHIRSVSEQRRDSFQSAQADVADLRASLENLHASERAWRELVRERDVVEEEHRSDR